MKKIIGCLIFLLINSVCFAGNRPGAFTFTAADAYYHFSSSRHLDNSSMPNVAFAYNVDEHWAMEAGVGVLNTNYRSGRGVHGFLYTIDGLYRFKPYKKYFEPYVIAGIGVLGLRPLPMDSEHQGNINAGIGTQLFADRSVALRAEVRDLYTLSGGKNDWMINFGVSFLIGK